MKKNDHQWDGELDKSDPKSVVFCTKCGTYKKKTRSRLQYYPRTGPSSTKNPECK